MAKPKILIVDDDADVLMLIAAHFKKAGAEVTTTGDPLSACEQIISELKEASTFDMIITDIFMPGMNGYEFVKKIRDAGYKGGIVAFTCNATMEGKREGIEAGIDTYLNKVTLKTDLAQALLDRYCS